MKKRIKLIKSNFMYGVSEPWCNDEGVAVLPFIYQYNQYWFLLIQEINPLLKNRIHQNFGTLTGGCNSNTDLLTIVKKKILETTGINTKEKKDISFYDLGSYYANKINIKIWHLYAVDLTPLKLNLQETYSGIDNENSLLKKNQKKVIDAIFLNETELGKTNDTFALAIYGKLKLRNIIPNSNPIIK